MLSKVAERLYWSARYIERVENTARLAKVFSQLMFDLPKAVKLNWYTLVQITSNEVFFDTHYEAKTEKNCMSMLLSDRDNSTSLLSSLWWARENMRTTRDILPREAWVHINELYLMVKENKEDFESRSKRNALLDKIIKGCQSWTGMMTSTMSQNNTYRFIMLGTAIERADMTSRILDVGGFFVSQETVVDDEYPSDSILWANLLKSVSAYFMYRQNVQTEITGQHVVDFLMKDKEFARSVRFCINFVSSVVSKLPNSSELKEELDALVLHIDQDTVYEVGSTALHDYLDELQMALSTVHNKFYEIWFNPKQLAA
ncbi:alpha-E domain-containing protein [Thiosulfativibrio zosterae]|uniref:DUF403 domain-containing protein n=1 Tax=Thiosulfativibrio zosterae TaxID=2675053 RepID=A0A6F8PNL2_9GAMM|nr:alpha-E domain-containing protein [Thiosulfativibrio zosterae]BBP43711.1 hypothetical protein THMIRHAT_14570 [Thiosulfativibrio zosterae]